MANDAPKQKNSKKQPKRALIVGVLVLFIVLFAGGIFLAFKLIDSSQPKQGSLSPQEEAIAEQQEVVKRASGEEKAEALNDLAGLYENNNQPNKAIEARKESYNIEKDPNTASSIALAACKQKDKATCQEFLEATINGFKTNSDSPNASFLPYYERRLVAVKQGNLKDEPSFMEGLEP